MGQAVDTVRMPEADRPVVPRSSTPFGAATPPEPLIIFLHLPKTGGTTLRRIVDRQYPGVRVSTTALHEATTAELHQFGQALPEETAVVQGHMH